MNAMVPDFRHIARLSFLPTPMVPKVVRYYGCVFVNVGGPVYKSNLAQ